MGLGRLSFAVLALSFAVNANSADQWQHGALCGAVVKGLATAPQFNAPLPNEKVIEWLGRNGWELAAIESNHCVADGSTLQKPLFDDLFWFKRRVDPLAKQSALPSAAESR